MRSKFREVVVDVWRCKEVQDSMCGCLVALASSETVGQSLALLLRNACHDDQAASGLSKVPARTAKSLSSLPAPEREDGEAAHMSAAKSGKAPTVSTEGLS